MSSNEPASGLPSGPTPPSGGSVPPAKRRRKRSAVSSGRKVFRVGRLSRTEFGRRFVDLCRDHVADLGGADNLSQAQLGLIRRASALEARLEHLEMKMAADEEVSLDEYGRAASHLRRLWDALGLTRQARDVTPVTLQTYLQALKNENPNG